MCKTYDEAENKNEYGRKDKYKSNTSVDIAIKQHLLKLMFEHPEAKLFVGLFHAKLRIFEILTIVCQIILRVILPDGFLAVDVTYRCL